MKIRVGMKEWSREVSKMAMESLFIKMVFTIKEVLVMTLFMAKEHSIMGKIDLLILASGSITNLME